MEYTQLTLDDWMNMKEQLKKDLNGVAESFVRIGYILRKIEEQQLYQKDGYDTIADFARKEYGLSSSTVSRFMAINEKYSIDGYSERLRPEFAGIGSSKLAEMLTLPDGDLELIRPETTRETIRELKQFNSHEPDAMMNDIRGLIESFFRDNHDILKSLYASEGFENGDADEMVEVVNPGGNRSYRKGIYFLMMYNASEGLKVKKFGQPKPENMSWAEFFAITRDIFGEELTEEEPQIPGQMAIPDDYPEATPVAPAQNPESRVNTRSEPVPQETENRQQEEEKPEETIPKKEEKHPEEPAVFTGEIENPEKEVAPAQEIQSKTTENRINTRSESYQEAQGQQDIAQAMNAPEVEAEQYITRKEYIDTLTAYGTAEYIYKYLTPKVLASQSALEYWLLKKVDMKGREDEDCE